VADNLIAQMKNAAMSQAYDGYGSCPLTVEHGKIILAEFGYGGKLMPSFPWDSTKPRRAAWFLKKSVLPWIYWNAMLKGKEWLAKTTSYISGFRVVMLEFARKTLWARSLKV